MAKAAKKTPRDVVKPKTTAKTAAPAAGSDKKDEAIAQTGADEGKTVSQEGGASLPPAPSTASAAGGEGAAPAAADATTSGAAAPAAGGPQGSNSEAAGGKSMRDLAAASVAGVIEDARKRNEAGDGPGAAALINDELDQLAEGRRALDHAERLLRAARREFATEAGDIVGCVTLQQLKFGGRLHAAGTSLRLPRPQFERLSASRVVEATKED